MVDRQKRGDIMKKQVVSVLLAAMVGTFALAGCGNNAQTAGSVAESTQVERTQAATSEEADSK